MLNNHPPSRSSRRHTDRDTVATDTPIVRAAAANERSSATFANIARPSKSGSLAIDNPATMNFHNYYFKNTASATSPLASGPPKRPSPRPAAASPFLPPADRYPP